MKAKFQDRRIAVRIFDGWLYVARWNQEHYYIHPPVGDYHKQVSR